MKEQPEISEAMARLENLPDAKLPKSKSARGLQIAGLVLRTAFIVSLIVLTLRVSMPQNETIGTAYDTPGDLVRLILGCVVCVWLFIQIFILPKDAEAYRTWIYLGLVVVPFIVICIFAVW